MYEITRIRDTVEEPVAFCIFCGRHRVVTGQDDKDYWTVLALDLGLEESNGDLVQACFDLWSPYDGDEPRFMDYAREVIRSASQQLET